MVAQMVKNPSVVLKTLVQSPSQEDPLEKGTVTHSSILAWRIPWAESLVGYRPRGHKESDMTEQLSLSLSKTPSSVSVVKISLTFLPPDHLQPQRG